MSIESPPPGVRPTAAAMRGRAIQMLLLATLFWGLSFCLTKALVLCQERLLPHASSWFLSAFTLTIRFGIAALVMGIWHAREMLHMTRLEWTQALGLGLFGGAGLVFQMDGLAYVPASTSAFLTQFYCLVIPLWVALRHRRWPSLKTMASCVMVLAGVAVLARWDWREMRLGQGELETLVGSIIFSGQILLLERPLYARNRMGPVTAFMFGVIALVCFPVAAANTRQAGDWLTAAGSWPITLCLAMLILFCTLSAYLLMNYWQPRVTATEAGLIYCTEPVFASVYALFLPAWFSTLASVSYDNERITWHLLLGGGLITAANLLIHISDHHDPNV